MAKQTINIGTTANDRTGDHLRSAMTKVNSNFTELYDADTSSTAYTGTAFTRANTAWTQANTGTLLANSAYNQANTGVDLASLAYTQANTGTDLANSSFSKANSAYDLANTMISLSSLQSVVASANDFVDFQTRIAAL